MKFECAAIVKLEKESEPRARDVLRCIDGTGCSILCVNYVTEKNCKPKKIMLNFMKKFKTGDHKSNKFYQMQ